MINKLPDRWYIKLYKEVADYYNQKIKGCSYVEDLTYYIHSHNFGDSKSIVDYNYDTFISIRDFVNKIGRNGYKEITLEEFKKYVLKKANKVTFKITRSLCKEFYELVSLCGNTNNQNNHALKNQIMQLAKSMNPLDDSGEIKASLIKQLERCKNSDINQMIKHNFPAYEFEDTEFISYSELIKYYSDKDNIYYFDGTDENLNFVSYRYDLNESTEGLMINPKEDTDYWNAYFTLWNIAKHYNKGWKYTGENTGYRFYTCTYGETVVKGQSGCVLPGVIYFKNEEDCQKALKLLTDKQLNILLKR